MFQRFILSAFKQFHMSTTTDVVASINVPYGEPVVIAISHVCGSQ